MIGRFMPASTPAANPSEQASSFALQSPGTGFRYAGAINGQYGRSAMHNLRKIKHLVLILLLLTPGTAAWADWELESTVSKIHFVSIKNGTTAEAHSFASLVGYIGAAGNAEITIELDSVQTLIAIRDERMREMLFETVKFPSATIRAQVDPDVLAVASEGGVLSAELPVTLSLHGQEKSLTIPVVIVGDEQRRLRVFSAQPVLINAADFGLVEGVAALQKVAGLDSISTAVPVTLQLLFVPAK
jgi:polyisoprenoid-binding protein YceI